MNLFQRLRWTWPLLFVALRPDAFAHTPAEDMTDAASRFLAALTTEQRAACTYALSDEERHDWHFIPRARKGVPLKEMTAAQRTLAHGLLATGLSQRGYIKATTIISLEAVLKELEQGRGPVRDSELYYVTVFGSPSLEQVWGWRVEGHHLSLNFTVAPGDHISVTPSFFGSNPAEVRTGPRQGLRVLGAEEDFARKLVDSLDDQQRRLAIYTNNAPADIITGADRKARFLEPQGLPASKMSTAQQELLWAVIREYVYRYRTELADKDLAQVRAAGLERIAFAWAGSTERGHGHYYRVQGPSFLLEYDNTQNNANHAHTVWRDLESDFGEDLLRQHYDADHKKSSSPASDKP